jgi:cyclophilin family peptidyl-prolyl cis-trans isomerase
VLPNFIVQTRTAAARDTTATFPREELGPWPQVRGAVALSAEHGDAQIFIDLVDNPRFDHQYTVFAQVLNGLDVVDALLEGDLVERIEIVPGP